MDGDDESGKGAHQVVSGAVAIGGATSVWDEGEVVWGCGEDKGKE